ncbi:hypothetical protein BWQ93_06040 [Sphingopyxis sp. QXT-31]|nr:hypothetical protein BWQ93_06040 [Sphingopyxis sp. QXT-31]
MTQITLPIRALNFPNARVPTRRFAAELLVPGDKVELRAEPKNPADPNAIAIDSPEGVQLGYLPAGRAPFVGLQQSRGDVWAIFQGLNEYGAFVRIAFNGEAPTLPPTTAAGRQPYRDWWPDDECPD